MDNNSTRKTGPLSLPERARLGLELPTWEIMALEFPTATSWEDRQQPKYESWRKTIDVAIRFGLLVAREETVEELFTASISREGRISKTDHTVTHYWVTPENYRDWRNIQANPPEGSIIHVWLGATPAIESPPAEPILPVENTLPLAERARRGYDLEIPDILALEFPFAASEKDVADRSDWKERLEYDVLNKLILSRLEIYPDGCLPGNCWITRADYLAWRNRQPSLPTYSRICLWLGAMPAIESLPAEHLPPVEPIPPVEPSRLEPVTKGGAAEKIAALLVALLDEVDKRAAKQDAGFNRHSLPGTKKEFHALAIEYNRRAFAKALSTFDGYIEGKCQFNCNGAKPEQGKGAAIWALFPEYKPRLG